MVTAVLRHPMRRRALWCAAVFALLFVLPAVIAAAARADSGAAAVTEFDGLSWTNIRDSAGIPLADYVFATDHGGLLEPRDTGVSMVLGLEFSGWLIVVTVAIWLIAYAVSFRWLDMFAQPLQGLARILTDQIATPIVIMTAASIGAVAVGWFVARGFHAKAAMQVVTMLGVAIFGVGYLAEPLADVLSSNGLLAQGRNVGISVAAGLNGNADPNPTTVVTAMQGSLADNFARRPLQVWNFGHVVDRSPGCRTAWSEGILSGNDSRVKNGMRSCGDAAAHAKASHPTMGQIGTGLLLLLCSLILLLFAAYLAVKVIWTGLDAVYHGIMAIFGFAAGGFVYGPTQTFLVRNLVDGLVAAMRMTAYTIFLGVYVLFLGSIFRQAGGQVMAVFVVGGIVEVIAILQLRRLSASLSRGNDWMANRFAAAVQGAPAGGGGGTALGMGTGPASRSLSSDMLTALAAVNTVNASPVTAWLWGKTGSPFNPYSRMKRSNDLLAMRSASHINRNGWNVNYFRTRQQLVDAARSAVVDFGGHSARSAAAAVERVTSRGGGLGDVSTALLDAGFTDERMIASALRVHSHRQTLAPNMWGGDGHIGSAVATLGVLKRERSDAAMALFRHTAHELAHTRFPDTVTAADFTATEWRYLDDYLRAPAQSKLTAIQDLAAGAPSGPLHGLGPDRGELMNRFLLPHLSRQYLEAAEAGDLPRAADILHTMANTDHWTGGANTGPAKSVPRF